MRIEFKQERQLSQTNRPSTYVVIFGCE